MNSFAPDGFAARIGSAAGGFAIIALVKRISWRAMALLDRRSRSGRVSWQRTG
ncbi:MAG: hypothetical protein O3A63_09695 [Proteobacteria bacterium]|nr:hypothetical protein [Pseudomonadota bacterium]